MRACLLCLGALMIVACGSEVTILGENLDPPSILPAPDPQPQPMPQPEPEPEPEPEPGTCATGPLKMVTVDSTCGYGDGQLGPIDAVETTADGMRIVAPNCTITVNGIGADVAASYAIQGFILDYNISPTSIELYAPQGCDLCTTCECPYPRPLLYAADTFFDDPDELPLPRTVLVYQGGESCREYSDAEGCDFVRSEIWAVALEVESNPNLPSNATELGSASVDEGETVDMDPAWYHVRNLRSHRPDADCLAIWGHPPAAFVLFREVAPGL